MGEAEEQYVRIAFDRHARGKCVKDGCAFCECENDLIDKMVKLAKVKSHLRGSSY